MSETAALEACPLVELTPLVDVPLIWVENRRCFVHISPSVCFYLYLHHVHILQLTFEVDERTPSCSVDPGNAEDVEPPS